ncbi:MAG TPA: DUF881 domain-containing protein [Jatrophihabitans sp.]|nr:DUF881 domain-containing protein [Jatrophihabitans sp.]
MTTGNRVDRTSALLNDLLNNTLDPGYRAAANRGRPRHWWDAPLVWLCCVAVGLLLVVAYQQNHRTAPAREAANRELIARINAAQHTGDQLAARAKLLAAQVASLRDAQLPGSSSQLQQLEIAAGAVAVSGPGMQIELGEPGLSSSAPNGRPGSTPQNQVAVIHDRELRAVVNELWSAGAEAVAVNGLRVSPLSVIRVAGEAILLDLQPLNPPYTVSAIGDRDGLQLAFAQSPIARQLKTMVAVDGISFRFGGKSNLTLPSVTVDQLRYAVRGVARPSTTPSPAASTPSPSTPESPR